MAEDPSKHRHERFRQDISNSRLRSNYERLFPRRPFFCLAFRAFALPLALRSLVFPAFATLLVIERRFSAGLFFVFVLRALMPGFFLFDGERRAATVDSISEIDEP